MNAFMWGAVIGLAIGLLIVPIGKGVGWLWKKIVPGA